ncbi:precorrin-3B synthase [Rhodoblastus acidophilus]|uniref:Precorrin-3B synthase n=1 Tax=Candidatus Rhodoblastus alkanivorans TaxID=2954117 RepID=A0ABS9Z920_9HYPH|nr:precorrin-3B synthase [Candidatus Rhodoblastus alkanivorans]MCI4679287.1 precorrin-3B synthase [Candidatus Rhodoblastus alkanivorans]MCI4684086.1 precorrin-3B synthase [Candidatus Rhodoblastus alkanivorans]MDI4641406.1 precorrin-3B synthase [Rhodoblastus acidophilus]
MTIENLRKGWCPGALAPMLSGDGYIFRLRLTNGVLSFRRATIFAALARRFGNGAFDLSSRANLQMRGVAEEEIEVLQAELRGLGLLDDDTRADDTRAEAVRNVVPSPLAGFDPSAFLDVRPLVAKLDQLLKRSQEMHDLPPKFGFAVDGGGALPLDVATDIVFTAMAPDRLAIFLGGVLSGEVAPENLCAAAEGLARNFLALRGDDRRMASVVARLGVAPLAQDVSVIARPMARNDGKNDAKILGAQPCGQDAFVGAGLLFGRIEADALEALAHEAEAHGAAELRLTPWRAILAVGLQTQAAPALAAKLGALGFLIDARDSRLAFTACPGAPACPSARGDTRALALALAPHWSAEARRIHISGCIKGCALHAPALTFVAESDGYALVENALARDEPSARGLDLAAMKQKLLSLKERGLDRL